jgi:AraC family transcriptional regulator, regulatory protein of adaptative response / methylated-DNA-[protein]-cysteine methyltransferase
MEKNSLNFSELSNDYTRIEEAIRYLEVNSDQQPDLQEIAAHIGLSEYHFQRLFTRWAGISPKRFLQYLTKEKACQLLSRSSLLDTTFQSGLSSPGRLHDLIVKCEAVTPGEYKSRGSGIKIIYGFHPTPFGECLIALTTRGICFLGFVQFGGRSSLLKELQHQWTKATLIEDPSRTASTVARIFGPSHGAPLILHLRGTNFQIKVWEALLRLPPGEAISYQALAQQIHLPGAARAVGNALARNPLVYLIPCHRVLQKTGMVGQYRYGFARKKAILAWELARADSP